MRPDEKIKIEEGQRGFMLSKLFSEDDYELRYALARSLDYVLHCSNSMSESEFIELETDGMMLGDGIFYTMIFKADCSGIGPRIPYRNSIYSDLERLIRNKLFKCCLNYTAEIDGNIAALTCYPRTTSASSDMFSVLLGSCRDIVDSIRESYGISCRVFISNAVTGCGNISIAYRSISDVVDLSVFWPERFTSDIVFSHSETMVSRFSSLTDLTVQAKRLYLLITSGSVDEAVGEVKSTFEKIRSLTEASIGQIIADTQVYFDFIQQEFVRQNILPPDRPRVCLELPKVKNMNELEQKVSDISNSLFNDYLHYKDTSLYINAIQDYIKSNISNYELSVSSIAERFSVSQPLLSLQFKKHTGENLSEYISKLRISNAKVLLTDTTLTLSEISLRSGFGSVATFHRAFKRYYGMSPGCFRKISTQS